LPLGRSEARVELFKILVVCVLIGIVISLGTALFHLSSGKGDSKKMVRALTIRVGLSVALFVILMTAWAMGLISPHGVNPG
jgi:cytochrome bd-type quinol oxidase subunit 2